MPTQLNLSSIARDSGLTPQALINIVNGHRRPSWPVSKRLEKTTGISAVKWIDGKVDRKYLTRTITNARYYSFSKRKSCQVKKQHIE